MLTLTNVNLTINPHAAEASPFISFFVKKKYIAYIYIFCTRLEISKSRIQTKLLILIKHQLFGCKML